MQPSPKGDQRTYWFRHNPEFCRTGDTFSQPVRSGQLRPEFFISDCGSLDAPQYICTGGIQAKSDETPNCLYLTERADLDREQMADMAARADRDPYEGSYWADEHGDMGLVS